MIKWRNLSKSMKMNLIEVLANSLHHLFVMNPTRYAFQRTNGAYATVYQNLTPAVIKKMLLEQESLLTYQEYQGYMRWVCLDFDIKKGFDPDLPSNQESLISEVGKAVEKLNSYSIPYLIECSGNRGLHLWVICDNDIDKDTAFSFISSIKKDLGTLPECIAIDLFPKTSVHNKNNKGIGLGVKIPLSRHKKSEKHSFFVSSLSDFSFKKNEWPSVLDNDFLESQLKIIENYKTVNSSKIFSLFNDKIKLPTIIKNIESNKDYEIDTVLNKLNETHCINLILKDYRSNLSHTNRLILVGLLARIKSNNNDNLGLDLLKSFFSRLDNYDEKETNDRIRNLKHLYPLSCNDLRKTLPIVCSGCKCEDKTSPIEILDNITVSYSFDGLNISEELFEKTKRAEINYINSNDEIAIHHIKREISELEYSDFEHNLKKLFSGELRPSKEVYDFKRWDSESKSRILVSHSSQDKIISSSCLSLLNDLWFDAFSNNSLGYRVNHNFNSGWIFENWLINWNIFVHNIKSIIYDKFGSYDNYKIIKIDLKSFYDTINHQKLRIKLLDQPVSPINERLNSLNVTDRSNYENIVNYLLSVTKLTNSECGVPQGPAYARFFAEIFLIGLDKLIEEKLRTGFEFYYRFVDDIFIFVENDNKSKELFEDIVRWLNSNELEINKNKTLLTTVEYFKKTNIISKYENDSKYSINKLITHKSSLSKKEFHRAILQAKNLLQDSKFGLKDNFRFVLSRFSNENELKYEKSILEPIIIDSKIGRGSMYKTFFRDYYFNKKDIVLLDSITYLNMNLLARDSYINEIVENFEEIDSLSLSSFINDISNESEKLTKVELITTIELSFKLGIDVRKELMMKVDLGTLKSILFSKDKYDLSVGLFGDEFFSKIFPLEIDGLDFILDFDNLVSNNNLSIIQLRSLSSYFWNRLSENEYKLFTLTKYEDRINVVFNLIGLFTIVLEDFTKFQIQLKHVWSKFLNYIYDSNTLINNQNWFEKINVQDFTKLTKSTVVSCITLLKEKGLVADCPDFGNVVERYRDIVLAIYNDCLTEEFTLDPELIASLRGSDKFIDWVYDHSAKMYPDTDICLSNIAHNNLIVMNKGTSFLVKQLEGNLSTFEYLNAQEFNGSVVFEIGNSYKKLASKFDRLNSFESIKKIIELYDSGKKFRDSFTVNGYPNYFMELSKTNEDDFPAIPHYAGVEYLFPKGSSKYRNDKEGFCELLLNLLYSLDLTLIDVESPYSYKIDAANEAKLFPQYCDSNVKKIDFLRKLIGYIDFNKSYIHAHSFEIAWANALFEMSNGENDFSRFLEHYLSHHEKANRPSKSQFYELIISPKRRSNDGNISTFFDTLKSNILVGGAELAISGMYSDLMIAIQERFPSEEFVLETIDIEVLEPDEFGTDDNKKLCIDSTTYDIEDKSKSYYFIDMENSVNLVSINNANIDTLSMGRLSFSAVSNDVVLIVLVPRSFEKVYEIMDFRARGLEKSDIGIEYLKLLYNFEDIIHSQNDSLVDASKILANHYWNKDVSYSKKRIIDWLLLFNYVSIKDTSLGEFISQKDYSLEYLYSSILDVVNRHTCIDSENISKFKDKLESIRGDSNGYLFTLKNINRDKNGLQHLIQSCGGDMLRTLKLEDCFSDIADIDAGSRYKITILGDVGISGTEFKKAMRFYFKNKVMKKNGSKAYVEVELTGDDRDSLINKECYFPFDHTDIKQWESFRNRFMGASSIELLTAVSTKQFEETVKQCLKDISQEFSLPLPNVEIASNLTLEKFNFDHFYDDIPYKKRELFTKLIEDKELLKSLFTDDWNFYKQSIKPNKIGNTNLILRLESTPKGRFRVFTAKSKVGKNSLFERRLEHNEEQ